MPWWPNTVRKLLCIAVVSGYRTKITVVTNYRATITVHYRGVQSIPWLPITVHQLLCNTVVAAYHGKRYRDEKSFPRKALLFSEVFVESFVHRFRHYLMEVPQCSTYSHVANRAIALGDSHALLPWLIRLTSVPRYINRTSVLMHPRQREGQES